MPPRVKIIESVEDKIKALVPLYIELGILDIRMVGMKFDVRVEFPSSLFCDLRMNNRD